MPPTRGSPRRAVPLTGLASPSSLPTRAKPPPQPPQAIAADCAAQIHLLSVKAPHGNSGNQRAESPRKDCHGGKPPWGLSLPAGHVCDGEKRLPSSRSSSSRRKSCRNRCAKRRSATAVPSRGGCPRPSSPAGSARPPGNIPTSSLGSLSLPQESRCPCPSTPPGVPGAAAEPLGARRCRAGAAGSPRVFVRPGTDREGKGSICSRPLRLAQPRAAAAWSFQRLVRSFSLFFFLIIF